MTYLKNAALVCAVAAVAAIPFADGALAKSKKHHHVGKSASASKSAPQATESKQTPTGGQPGGPADKN